MLSCVGPRGVLAFANTHFEDQEWKRLLTLLGDLALRLARGEGMRPLWSSCSIHDSPRITRSRLISSS